MARAARQFKPHEAISEAAVICITYKNHKRLKCQKEMWHWMKNRGFEPNKSGWAKRMIGQTVPVHFMR